MHALEPSEFSTVIYTGELNAIGGPMTDHLDTAADRERNRIRQIKLALAIVAV